MTRRGTRWGVGSLVVVMLLLTGGATARGDACSECGPPTLEDLQQEPGFALEKRGFGALDEVHLHAGECRIRLAGPPHIQKRQSWLVLRGKGAVWNCPSSTATDTMTATVTESDSRDWSFSVSSSASASVLGVGLSAEVVATVRAASAITKVTTISKEMSAAWCRVIGWEGYFELADYSADVTFAVERRFAWWTKNACTGHTVHRNGELWLACGVHAATLDMRAPIAGYFKLDQTRCPDAECASIPALELGFFPPLPPGLRPPVTPGDGQEKEDAPGEEAEGEADDTAEPPPTVDPEADDDVPASDELGDAPTGALPAPPEAESESAPAEDSTR